MTADSLLRAPLAALSQALRQGKISARELAAAYLAQVQAQAKLNAFITPPDERSLRQAAQTDRRRGAGDAASLLGIPIAVKDLFATRGVRTTGGSKILRDWVPSADAAVVATLRRQGALIFGKTNLHEFAYGVSNTNPWWGAARNPHDPDRIPGGSSGGSAIAVVAGMAAAAVGSDTGGSIRIPAALCGCVGLKPTFGLVSLEGAIPLGWSLDHAGPITRTVDDAGILLDALTESGGWRRARAAGASGLRGTRIGLLRGKLLSPLEPPIAAAVEAAATSLRRHGLRVNEIEIPELQWTVAMQLMTLRAEATALHARWLRARPRDYGRDVRVRLQLGALVSGAEYALAQQARARLGEALRAAFESVDVLLLPTTPTRATPIGERTKRWRSGSEPVDGALVRLTSPFNLTGVPALSLPSPDAQGLPIGLQLVGRWHDEVGLLRVGRLLEGQ